MDLTQFKLGCLPSKLTGREWKFKDSRFCKLANLPETVRRIPTLPPIYNQGRIGSCTGNMAAKVVHIIDPINFGYHDGPSRLYPYYRGRQATGSEASDCGASILDVVESLRKYGIPHETLWPYIEDRFAIKPSDEADADAEKHQALEFHWVDHKNVDEVKAALVDYPLACGILVFPSMDNDYTRRTGKVPMPSKGEYARGGHAVVPVEYEKNGIWFANSWGEWGADGYGFIEWDYLVQYAMDCAVVKRMEPPEVPPFGEFNL